MKDDDWKNKKWLIIKLLIVIIPGIFYWVTNDDNFEKKVSFNVSMDAGVSSKKTDSITETPQTPQKEETKNPPPPVVQTTNQDNILLANQKYYEGVAAFNRKDYTAAVNLYTQAIELNPNHTFAYHNRAVIYQLTNNFNQALADVNKAMQLEPNIAIIYNTRGNVYRSLKNYNQAISDFDKSIQLDPNYSEAYSNRGNCYAILKNYNQAISDCTKAIQLKSDNASAYMFRGISYGCLENLNQAVSDLNTAIQLGAKLSPINLAIAHNSRGVFLQKLGENAKAQEDLARAKILGYVPPQN